MEESKLPNKLSALLRLAVQDAQKCEQDPRFKLNMHEWYNPDGDSGKCEVCMAGAVMAQTLALGPDSNASGVPLGESLDAINRMRNGAFYSAYNAIADGQEHDWETMPADNLACEQQTAINKCARLVRGEFDDYAERAPWVTYLEAADILERAGL